MTSWGIFFVIALVSCTWRARAPSEWQGTHARWRRVSCSSCRGRSSGIDPCSSKFRASGKRQEEPPRTTTENCRCNAAASSPNATDQSQSGKQSNFGTRYDCRMVHHWFSTFSTRARATSQSITFFVCFALEENFLADHRVFQTRLVMIRDICGVDYSNSSRGRSFRKVFQFNYRPFTPIATRLINLLAPELLTRRARPRKIVDQTCCTIDGG